MPRVPGPYQGTYSPAGLRMTAAELKAGLKGLKIKAPNRKFSTQAYKSGIPKEYEAEKS